MSPNISKLYKNNHFSPKNYVYGGFGGPKSDENGVGRVSADTVFRAIFAYLYPYRGPQKYFLVIYTPQYMECDDFIKKNHQKMPNRSFMMIFPKNSLKIFKGPYLGTFLDQILRHGNPYSSYSFQATGLRFLHNHHT